VDLSDEFLNVVRAKAAAEQLDIRCVKANLVELDAVDDASVDYAMCLFSTLGMIRGRDHRRQALKHVRRIVKPAGVFVIHVHNYWYNLYDPGGPWWLLGNLTRSWLDRRIEAGDKFFDCHGIPNMFLHVFTRRELRSDLRRTGFVIKEWIPLAPQRYRELRGKWFCESLRANGWIAVCT
jgi:SAM-dependent methyltransferase